MRDRSGRQRAGRRRRIAITRAPNMANKLALVVRDERPMSEQEQPPSSEPPLEPPAPEARLVVPAAPAACPSTDPTLPPLPPPSSVPFAPDSAPASTGTTPASAQGVASSTTVVKGLLVMSVNATSSMSQPGPPPPSSAPIRKRI